MSLKIEQELGQMGSNYGRNLLCALILSTMAAGCSAPDNQEVSELNWVPNGSETAVLQSQDLEDEFALKVNIVRVSGGLPANLINLGLQADVSLKALRGDDGLVLSVVNDASANRMLTFDLKRTSQGYVIDFAAPKNYINLESAVQQGDSEWSQDKDYIQASVNRMDEDTIETDLVFRFNKGTQRGLMVVAVSLSRKLVIPNQMGFAPKKAAAGFAKDVGFFEENNYVKRYPLPVDGKKIVFYIEGYPVDMQEDAIAAIESWNEVFDEDIIEAKVAPSGVHFGDRKYNVVKWYKEDVGSFTGRASPVYANASGQVYSGNVQMNGGFIEKAQTRIGESQLAYQRLRQTQATIGGTRFAVMPGEQPFVPFYIGQDDVDTISAVKRMYYDTLVHEIGHVLGLRHNFRGSLNPDSGINSASVMDYGPRAESNFGPSAPGSYDRKAIRWAYYDEEPGEVKFCTDDDVDSNWDCNKADWGNPVEFVNNSVLGAIEFIKIYDEVLTPEFLNSTKTFTGHYKKFTGLTLPDAEAEYFKDETTPNFMRLLKGDLGVSGVQKKNLTTLREIANTHLKCLATQEPWKC